ncbi:MAG: Trm112 family protein [Acidobacteria bacterium]|nr:Trm112 family protein [Acidobacteriota bacterium]
MIDTELLEILACPENKTPVRLADAAEIESLNGRISAGGVTNRGGSPVKDPVDGGLIREDGAYLYAIRDEIPVMLIDEAIPLTASPEE